MPGQRDERRLPIGSAVRFPYRGAAVEGHLLRRQGRRRFAKVIDAEDRIWNVPEAALRETGGPRRATLVTPQDEARAAFRLGDKVTFAGPDGPVGGEIVKLNARTARIRCAQARWVVPYGLLQAREKDAPRTGGAARLNAVAAMARGLMDAHGLADWMLAFVESGRRLGDCGFDDRVIRIGRAHALDGGEAEIRDTVLHEIAHALAGPEAGHGPLWREAARRLGATPRAKAHEKV